MCVRGLSYVCVYTWGLDTPTASQHNLFDWEKLKMFLVLLTGFEPLTFGSPAPDGIRTLDLWISSPTLTTEPTRHPSMQFQCEPALCGITIYTVCTGSRFHPLRWRFLIAVNAGVGCCSPRNHCSQLCFESIPRFIHSFKNPWLFQAIFSSFHDTCKRYSRSIHNKLTNYKVIFLL